jgi:hypothetical protein
MHPIYGKSNATSALNWGSAVPLNAGLLDIHTFHQHHARFLSSPWLEPSKAPLVRGNGSPLP